MLARYFTGINIETFMLVIKLNLFKLREFILQLLNIWFFQIIAIYSNE